MTLQLKFGFDTFNFSDGYAGKCETDPVLDRHHANHWITIFEGLSVIAPLVELPQLGTLQNDSKRPMEVLSAIIHRTKNASTAIFKSTMATATALPSLFIGLCNMFGFWDAIVILVPQSRRPEIIIFGTQHSLSDVRHSRESPGPCQRFAVDASLSVRKARVRLPTADQAVAKLRC